MLTEVCLLSLVMSITVAMLFMVNSRIQVWDSEEQYFSEIICFFDIVQNQYCGF